MFIHSVQAKFRPGDKVTTKRRKGAGVIEWVEWLWSQHNLPLRASYRVRYDPIAEGKGFTHIDATENELQLANERIIA